MKLVRINNKTYNYIKFLSKHCDETIVKTIDFIIDVFQQIPMNAIVPLKTPNAIRKEYKTYKHAFYEQNKHKLEEHQRKFFESSKENMRIFYKQNKKELMIFRATYALSSKETKKERIKQYNKKYYNKRKVKINEYK